MFKKDMVGECFIGIGLPCEHRVGVFFCMGKKLIIERRR
jgi:hypothetical protein